MVPNIPQETRDKQHQASNPNQSVWVSANAGSGKTHVLASRVIRLLLQGVVPSKILCLTFTKAAAANMAERVFHTLAGWTQLADRDLGQQIVEAGTLAPNCQELDRARKLFARTLETPGGLKIQTIHAFCERLLHLFPFEANVPARFEVPDERSQMELLERARRAVLTEANSGKGALGAAVQCILDDCGPEAFEGLIHEAMRTRAVSRARSPQAPVEILRRSLGLAEGRDVAGINREIAEGGIPPERWSVIAACLDQGSTNDQKKGKLLRQALADYRSAASGGGLGAFIESYLAIFFTAEDELRKDVVTKAIAQAHPEVEAELRAEQRRLDPLRDTRKAAATLDRTGALIEVASAIFQRYGAEKAVRGILDFDDLIDKTLNLLERSDARWVLYKLDAGIDHILVDEAQDTSEAQWKILEALTGEFAAGQGQNQGPRTFFAVGDEKQSIFSFQGAAPRMFDEMRRKFQKQFLNADQSFAYIPLTSSFRSAPGVLAAIDKVFEHGEHKIGVVTDAGWAPHAAVKRRLPGLVELWPLASAQTTESPREWRLPLDLLDEQDPANVVAQRIAQKIAQLIDPRSGECVHDSRTLQPRPVRPGDILILVRTRSAFFEAMIRALKKSHIETAGADRLDLTNHIAVLDLMAAGRASLLPQDDLTLACVLKSPLIGLDDEDLMAIAPHRGGSLFEALRASKMAKHAKAASKLALWRTRAGGGPFAFYAALLGTDGGRRDMEARLGPEAGDALDEFLSLAMAHEGGAAPSLAGFLNDVMGIDYSIKRDMETCADAVRVMTVHAAKGLEAKIVFLPDTCGVPAPNHSPKIFSLGTYMPGEETIAWSPKKDLDCAAVAAARKGACKAAMEEYKRLLYVALTRAEERLYIAGFHGARETDAACWAMMIEAALGQGAEIEKVPAFWGGENHIRRIVSAGTGVPAAGLRESQTALPPVPLPDWLRRAPLVDTKAMERVRPSIAFENLTRRRDGPGLPGGRSQAALRGRLIHLLLQYLPGVTAGKRRDAALAFLSAQAAGLDDQARRDLAEEALKVMDLPELAGLFGPGSKAEVSALGRLALGQRMIDVSGQIDRIAERPNEILLADFKTGVPRGLGDIPAAYLTQMALYRAVLAPLWPNKSLRVLLIWTAEPLVVPLPAEGLAAALAAFACG